MKVINGNVQNVKRLAEREEVEFLSQTRLPGAEATITTNLNGYMLATQKAQALADLLVVGAEADQNESSRATA